MNELNIASIIFHVAMCVILLVMPENAHFYRHL